MEPESIMRLTPASASWMDMEINPPPTVFFDVYKIVRDFVLSLPNYSIAEVPCQTSGIYFIFCNEFEYVGKSVDIEKRINQHRLSGLARKYHRVYIRQTKHVDAEEAFFIMTLMPNSNRSINVGSLRSTFSALFWTRPRAANGI
jgi:hypothetical protein